jgi:hypothetical protein
MMVVIEQKNTITGKTRYAAGFYHGQETVLPLSYDTWRTRRRAQRYVDRYNRRNAWVNADE